MSAALTQRRLREVLSYDPATGFFTWLVAASSRVDVGQIAGWINESNGYVHIAVDGTTYLAHRLVWLCLFGEWPDVEIDHRDGVRSNNRQGNLRPASTQFNQENKRQAQINNQSCGLLGVSAYPRNKSKPWQAKIQVQGRRIFLGYFATPDEAHASYVAAKRDMHAGCTI